MLTMTLKNLFLIWFLFNFVYGTDCPSNFIEIDGGCYFKQHVDVLQDFIDINKNLENTDILNIGHQEWTDSRLTYLYLGNQNISTIPDSIGLLKDLLHLDLEKNNISTLPEGVCSIYPYYSQLNLSDNKICPPYPYCFDYIGKQETNDCESFNCPEDYTEIQGECYYNDHLQILKSIIDTNAALEGLAPLELGKDIGFQHWENGMLSHLNLINNNLTVLPENLCDVYPILQSFDVSNNSICPPYPPCFEYIGYQNTQACDDVALNNNNISSGKVSDNSELIFFHNSSSELYLEKFHNYIDILQSFIDNNESIKGMDPLEIGKQEWKNMRLVSLDLSSLGLTNIPLKICTVYSNLSMLDLSNNAICPPYPDCLEYVDFQNKEACEYLCPDNYSEIDGECYFAEHLKILQDIIDNNPSLEGKSPLEIGGAGGMQNWIGGKLNQLILVGNQLTEMPESICDVHSKLSAFDMTNNFICPPYPSCIENLRFQNTDNCTPPPACPEGYVVFDGECYFEKDISMLSYYYDDLQVLMDFTRANDVFAGHHPLLIGYQVWQNNRLKQLSLDGLEITVIPESIYKLTQLEYLNLNNNKLESLPDTLCSIYPNLQSFQVTNNWLCPPYMQCFDFIGKQNVDNCKHGFCPYGYLEIDGECYFEKDISTLKDFISQNESLSGRAPLDIGVQKWKDMRLHYLYLGVNQLTTIPESVCEIMPQLKTFNISQNYICQPYPVCVEKYIGEQDGTNCP